MRVPQNIKSGGKVLSAVRRSLSSLGGEGRLLACVSGGADSVAMLHALRALGAEVEVANCNFHLRGEESDRDSAFVAQLCDRLGIRLHRLDFDTKTYCAEHHLSAEMGCRELRYAAFRRLRDEFGFRRIVVAHNADDNVETLLLNLLRGTGLKGLCGMEPDTGEILRPLLDVPRADIEAYLKEIGADYVTDSTNGEDDYRRNFLRLRVLPLLESRWPGARKAIAATIGNLRCAEAVYEKAIADALGDDDRSFVSREAVETSPARRALLHAAFAGRGATPSQLREMELTDRAGASWRLPNGTIYLDKDGFRFVDDSGVIGRENFRVDEMELTDSLYERIISAGNDNNTVWLPGHYADYRWDVPAAGMRFHPLGMSGTRKVADMLRDARVPVPMRASHPLLVESATGNIVWIPGVRRSRFATVERDSGIVTRIEAAGNLYQN